jgi:hypothetical protein
MEFDDAGAGFRYYLCRCVSANYNFRLMTAFETFARPIRKTGQNSRFSPHQMP